MVRSSGGSAEQAKVKAAEAANKAKMGKPWRIVVLGCTHGLHHNVPLSWWPDGDLLLVCGDLLGYDNKRKCLEEANPWRDLAKALGQLRREKYKLGVIVTGGNHDFPASQAGGQGYLCAMAAFKAEGVGFAVDERIRVQDDDGNFLRIFASPMSCYRGNKSCAFQVHRASRPREEERWCESHDKQQVLPTDSTVVSAFPRGSVDILMTHGPPLGIGDQRYCM
jgi:predicted MPP superfamily phosphohydrolase